MKRKAEDENWEFDDFDVERQVLDDRFQFWLPRYTVYSVVTLLYNGPRYAVAESVLDENDFEGCWLDADAEFLPASRSTA